MAEHPFDEQRAEADALAKALIEADAAGREFLERIMNLLPCYVALIDENHRILYHNKAFTQFFGKPDDKRCHKIMRGRATPCPVCLPFRPGKRVSGVFDWVDPQNGNAFRVHIYPFTEPGGRVCILEMGFNVTDALRVQQALDLSEQSYRAITDNLSIGIALLSPKLLIKAGNVRLHQWFAPAFGLNRRICALLRCGSEHERAAEDHDFTCPDCPFQASFQDGQGHEKEISLHLDDGKEHVMRLVTCPVRAKKTRRADSRPRAMILMLEDITNRLRMTRQLQRARKLEAMSTLAGGIAHEINQPLSALHLYAGGLQMLLEKERELPKERVRERMDLIMSEADKIRSIISHMRSLVLQEKPAPLSGVSLAEAVNSALGIFRQQLAARGIALRLELEPDLPAVRSNPVQLEQVLVNLLGNALHALAALKADKNGPPEILVRAVRLAENGRVRLEVADSGPGLADGGEHIFDPFFTTKERHEGMGLGLSIVHGFTRLWGADISAVPRHPETGGAAFVIDLKVAEKRTAGESGTASEHGAAGKNAAAKTGRAAKSAAAIKGRRS